MYGVYLIAQLSVGEIQQRAQLFGVKFKFNRNFGFFARAAAQLLLHEIENRAQLVNVMVLIELMVLIIAFIRVKLILQYAHGHGIIAHAFVSFGCMCICGRTERRVVSMQQRAQFRDGRPRPIGLVVLVVLVGGAQFMFHDVDERAQIAGIGHNNMPRSCRKQHQQGKQRKDRNHWIGWIGIEWDCVVCIPSKYILYFVFCFVFCFVFVNIEMI
jgi:hypothetical protein